MTGESDRDKMILKLSHREVHSGQHMDEDEKRETLRDAGLDPVDYEVYPSYTPPYTHHSAPNPVNTDKCIPSVSSI